MAPVAPRPHGGSRATSPRSSSLLLRRRLTRWDVAGRLRPTLEVCSLGGASPGLQGRVVLPISVSELERERVSRRTVYFKSSVNEGYIGYGENCGRTFG